MSIQNSRIRQVDVDDLCFDPQNPRLPSSVNGNNETDVLEWMLKDGTIPELMGSLGEHGYFEGEPMLVVPLNGATNKYHVVEGNRRLAALKLLHNPDLAPTRKKSVRSVTEEAKVKPKLIPALEFAQRSEILDYLGYRHITGIKPWSSLAKAKYLRQLRERNPDITFYELAKQIGSRSDYVGRLLTGLEIYDIIEDQHFFDIEGLNEQTLSFSLITTAINYNNIAKFLNLEKGAQDPTLSGLSVSRLHQLTRWFFEKDKKGKTALGESRNIKVLNAVVDDRDALKSFEEHGRLDDAYLLTGEPAGAFRSFIVESRDKLVAAQGQIHRVNEFSDTDLELLREIATLLKNINLLVSQALMDINQI